MRVAGGFCRTVRSGEKAMVDFNKLDILNLHDAKALPGDGNIGGAWQKADDVMLEIWKVGVEKARAELQGLWPDHAA